MPRKSDGLTVTLTVSKWGGVFTVRHRTYFALRLGWVTLMLMPRDLVVVLTELIRNK